MAQSGSSWSDAGVIDVETAALDLMRQIVDEAYGHGTAGPVETGFIYRHANNLVWLGDEVAFLAESNYISGPPLLVRAMLESVFCLGVCTRIENFPARKTISELREWLRRVDTLEIPDDADVRSLLPQVRQKMDDLHREYAVETTDPVWTVARCAREAGEVGFLRKHYFLLSQHTHSSSIGLLSRHDGIDAGITHQAFIGSLAIGAGLSVQLLQTDTPQAHIDAAAAILARLSEMIRGGTFSPVTVRDDRSP